MESLCIVPTLFIDQYNRLLDDLDDCKQQSHLNAWKEGNRNWLDRFSKDKPKEYQEILGWYKVKKEQIKLGNLSSIREDIPIWVTNHTLAVASLRWTKKSIAYLAGLVPLDYGTRN